MTTKTAISVAHSPDSDDAFMFYALAENKIDSGNLAITQVMNDIQTLNVEARKGLYDVTAISFAAYPSIADKYKLLTCGSSIGDGYGPLVVTAKPMTEKDLESATIAIPGRQTSAYLTLRMYNPNLRVVDVPFNQIISEVQAGNVDAGLIIHEGQLTYASAGLNKVIDLGQWWQKETGLPLPLGGNAIRRDIEDRLAVSIADLLEEAISYALKHRREALTYALRFAPAMPEDLADQYVGMYVNELTVNLQERGKEAVHLFFKTAYERGLLDKPVQVDFCQSSPKAERKS